MALAVFEHWVSAYISFEFVSVQQMQPVISHRQFVPDGQGATMIAKC